MGRRACGATVDRKRADQVEAAGALLVLGVLSEIMKLPSGPFLDPGRLTSLLPPGRTLPRNKKDTRPPTAAPSRRTKSPAASATRARIPCFKRRANEIRLSA